MTTEQKVQKKLIDKLDLWCAKFMTVGTSGETPRYSQVIDRALRSTVADVYYDIDFELDELLWIDEMTDNGELWGWWKKVRTEHLVKNYKTIKL
jgi:hypothetical protein